MKGLLIGGWIAGIIFIALVLVILFLLFAKLPHAIAVQRAKFTGFLLGIGAIGFGAYRLITHFLQRSL